MPALEDLKRVRTLIKTVDMFKLSEHKINPKSAYVKKRCELLQLEVTDYYNNILQDRSIQLDDISKVLELGTSLLEYKVCFGIKLNLFPTEHIDFRPLLVDFFNDILSNRLSYNLIDFIDVDYNYNPRLALYEVIKNNMLQDKVDYCKFSKYYNCEDVKYIQLIEGFLLDESIESFDDLSLALARNLTTDSIVRKLNRSIDRAFELINVMKLASIDEIKIDTLYGSEVNL